MFDDWRTELPTVLARALWTNLPHCRLRSERHPRILSHVCHGPTLHWMRAQIEVPKGGRFGLFWPVCTHHEEIYCGAKLQRKNAIGVQAAGMLVFLCWLPDFALLPSKLLQMLRSLFRSLDILAMQLPTWCMPLDMFVLLPKPALHREPLRSSDQPVQMHQILRSNCCNPVTEHFKSTCSCHTAWKVQGCHTFSGRQLKIENTKQGHVPSRSNRKIYLASSPGWFFFQNPDCLMVYISQTQTGLLLHVSVFFYCTKQLTTISFNQHPLMWINVNACQLMSIKH